MKMRFLLPLIALSAGIVWIFGPYGRDEGGAKEATSSHSCRAVCEHSVGGALRRQEFELGEKAPWLDAAVGEWVSLGFGLGEMSEGQVTMREELADGRVVTSLLLKSGDDLFIGRYQDSWEGRVIPRAGGPGWRIRGAGGHVSVEELERGALICSSENSDGHEISGLPPVRGSLPEQASSAVAGEAPVILNSLPGANGVIYLDFDGETVSGTQWNSSYTGGASIVAGSANFTNTQIETVWKGVSEDYRPFDVTVTTDRAVYESYPISRRAMLIFTPDNEWYGEAGGVAYVDVFGLSNFDAPGWVFTDMLANSADYSSEAASHEAGHMLGLRHDGSNSVSYYEGHGSGATSWAPIMGVGYYATVTQWSKGEYPNANNLEDDLAIISRSANGLGYRGDDHSGSTGGATLLTLSGADQLSGVGLIERNTDIDVHSFQTSGGLLSIEVDNADYGPNLDIKLRLLDGSGAEIAVSDAAATLDASLSLAVSAGTYHLEISGVGKGDLSTGYGDYGSLGAYSISGTAPQDFELAADVVSPSVAAISLPEGSGLLLEGLVTGGTASWEIVSVPAGGSVGFSDSASQSTEAVFSGAGSYGLQLKGSSDGEQVVDAITVSVEAAGSVPLFSDQAPGVDLGRDRTVYGDQLVLAPMVLDDSPTMSLEFEWSIRSGSGQLSSTSVEDPMLSFPSAEATTLRLVVNDGVSRTFDEVTLTANFQIDTLIGEGAQASAWVAVDDSLGDLWKSASFSESGWLTGSLGAGYDAVNGPSSRRIYEPLIGSGLDVESSMYKTQIGCYLRVPFNLVDPMGVLSLRLRMKFDDGFVAYLNGTEVARGNAPAGTPAWNSAAASNRNDEDALSAVAYSIDLSAITLSAGENILAVHGMNSSVANTERSFLLVPELEATLTETPFYAAVSVVVDPAMRAPFDDADGDGRVNLYEHAAGTSLILNDEAYKMVASTEVSETSLTIPANAPDDILYVLEFCPDLSPPWVEVARKTGGGSWVGQQPLQVSPVAGGREEIRFATADGPMGFFRLKMELVTP